MYKSVSICTYVCIFTCRHNFITTYKSATQVCAVDTLTHMVCDINVWQDTWVSWHNLYGDENTWRSGTYRTYPYNQHDYIPTTPAIRACFCAVRLRFASDRSRCDIFARLLHLNLIDCLESFLRKRRVLNFPERLQFWQIAKPLLYTYLEERCANLCGEHADIKEGRSELYEPTLVCKYMKIHDYMKLERVCMRLCLCVYSCECGYLSVGICVCSVRRTRRHKERQVCGVCICGTIAFHTCICVWEHADLCLECADMNEGESEVHDTYMNT